MLNRKATGSSDSSSEGKKGPVFTRKAWTGTGSVDLAVFTKDIDGDNGPYVTFNTTVKRIWKEGDKYESSNSFRQEDLLTLALFLQEAASFIITEQNKRK